MIKLIEKTNNAKTNNSKIDSDRADNNEADNDKIDCNRLYITTKIINKLGNINWLKDIGEQEMTKNIRINIVISKFKTLILFNFYFNIFILSRFTIYQL